MILLRPILRAALLFVIATLPAQAAFETRAEAAFVLDLTTDTVLLSKQADVPIPPASMSKLMTLYMLFEALRDGRVTMETRFGVSDRAAAMGGSTMYLDQRDRPTVEELIQGIIVQSGNDATVVVAEGLAGTEDAFARLMNDHAASLGFESSTFTNASGWPNPNHRMSVHDLGRLAARIITEFPEYYGYFAQKEFEFDGRAPQNRFNRNPLLELGIGADGLKTGHTQEAGYGLVGSAQQGNRRIVFVVSGLPSEDARAQESERIVSWAFRQFVQREVADEGTVFAEAPVWMGERNRVRPGGARGPDPAAARHATGCADRTGCLPRAARGADRSGRAGGRARRGTRRSPRGAATARRRPGHRARRVSAAAQDGRDGPRPQGTGRSTGPALMRSGRFITFEGIDGAGKSTQVRLLAQRMREAGHDVLTTREPGGSSGAEAIRRLLVEGETDRWSPQTETLLFTAARRDHLEKLIDPALAKGRTVLCDRFADSTRVYQGAVRADLRRLVDSLHDMVIGREPDLTFIIDVDPTLGWRRSLERRSGEARFERFGPDFQAALRCGFLDLAASAAGRCRVVDGNRTADAVADDIAAIALA